MDSPKPSRSFWDNMWFGRVVDWVVGPVVLLLVLYVVASFF